MLIFKLMNKLAAANALLVFFFPLAVSAAGLIPCGGPGEEMCKTEHVTELASTLISFLISMLGIIAVIALVIVGFQMVISAGNETAWTKAKNTFSNIVIGIIIILAAWLIVDLVLTGLTGRGLNVWTSFSL